MELPDINDKVWNDLLFKDFRFELNCLALKILLSRLRFSVKFNSLPENVLKSTKELREFFNKTRHMQSVRSDLTIIMQSRGIK